MFWAGRGGSNEYLQSMFWAEKKNNVYPCKPQFYYIKVGFKGVKFTYIGMFQWWQCTQCAINLTPKGIFAKQSVSNQYWRKMGPTYAVIPENYMNKTFHISCRMPWLRNDDSLSCWFHKTIEGSNVGSNSSLSSFPGSICQLRVMI